MKTRKEALQDEIKIYEDMIEKAKERRETTSSYLEINQIKYQVKEYKEQIRMDEKEIKDLEAIEEEEKGMEMDVKIKLDEIRNYLQHNGELCDDRGNKILEIDIDGKTGEPIVETKNRSFVILDEYINKLYKRMELMRREIGISGNVVRGVITVNSRIVDYKRFIDSDEFQSSSEGDKEMKEKADKLEEKAQEQIRVETYLVEREIERLEKIKMVLDWYEPEAFTGKMYDMSLYDNNAEQIDEFEVY